MSTTEKYAVGNLSALLTTGLNSLASGALAVSPAFDNTQGGLGGDGWTLADLELVVSFGTGPTTGQVSVWFLGAPDGTNYEDGADGSTTPARGPDVVFPVRAVTTAQRIVRRVRLPWGAPKLLVKNDGTGQAFAASGNTLKLRPATLQAV